MCHKYISRALEIRGEQSVNVSTMYNVGEALVTYSLLEANASAIYMKQSKDYTYSAIKI